MEQRKHPVRITQALDPLYRHPVFDVTASPRSILHGGVEGVPTGGHDADPLVLERTILVDANSCHEAVIVALERLVGRPRREALRRLGGPVSIINGLDPSALAKELEPLANGSSRLSLGVDETILVRCCAGGEGSR